MSDGRPRGIDARGAPASGQQVSSLARAVSADIRARLGAERRSGKWLAEQIGLSQNYVAKRLRDEAPFNLDDLAAIAEAFGIAPTAWLDSKHDLAARIARKFAPGPNRVQGHSEGATAIGGHVGWCRDAPRD